MKGYAFGFVFGVLLSVSGAALAAVGDLIYIASPTEAILSGQDAADIADCFIAKSVWTGTRASITSCTISRADNGTFPASCSGTKTASSAALPINGGVQVVGRVE